MSRTRSGTLRIVGGAHRGRRIQIPPNSEVRPTADRVREAIFDVLGSVRGLQVLDLFAGSGAMGLEALSRGCTRCVFVEGDKKVADVLRANIQTLAYDDGSAEVLVADYRRAAERLMERTGEGGHGARFELFFVDPPYTMLPEVEVMLRPLLPALLSDKGLVVVEGPRSVAVDVGLDPVFDRTYGHTRVVMLEMRRNSP